MANATDYLNIHTDPAIRGEEGFFKNVDDILCSAQNIKQLEERMKKLLTICREKNMKIAPSKFQLGSSVVFGGTLIEAQHHIGDPRKTVLLSPTPKKLEAFLDFPTPSCKKDVQSIMGPQLSSKDGHQACKSSQGTPLLSSGTRTCNRSLMP